MTESNKNAAGEKQDRREESPPLQQPRDNPPPPYQGRQSNYPNYYPYGMSPQNQQPFWAYPAIPAPAGYDGPPGPTIPMHTRPAGASTKPAQALTDEKARLQAEAPPLPPKQEKKQQQQPPQQQPPPAYQYGGTPRHGAVMTPRFASQTPPHPSSLRGHFSRSSARMALADAHVLVAECRALSGCAEISALRLDRCLTNNNGNFQWVIPGVQTGNFGASARNVRLVEGGRWLEAELARVDGVWQWDRICLDERITNDNGCLKTV